MPDLDTVHIQESSLSSSVVIIKKGIYYRFIKRAMDFLLSFIAIICFVPVFLIIAFLVRIKLGSPVIFTQKRPGQKEKDGREKIFLLYKFRSMTNQRDKNGNLLPDNIRMTRFGKMLRDTSLDELPELFNILKGEMSIIGPRPQLVRDMVFMTDRQRQRHNVRPGLSGLAQVNGRNSILWESKLEYDLKYIEHITFLGDLKLIIQTIRKVFARVHINTEGMATAEDLGDYLLRQGKISQLIYDEKQKQTIDLLNL